MFYCEYATHTMDDYDQGSLNKLKRLRQETNWEVKRERQRLSRKLYPLIENWVNNLPDLREIFQQEEIEWLLVEDMKKLVINGRNCSFLEFVFRTGYKDVPGVDEDGKPLLRRTTPLHYLARHRYGDQNVIDKLFEIYDSDANYTDESGFSHLHAACMLRQCRIVELFIQHGQDPNLVWPETDDTPLLLTLRGGDYQLAETLMRLGANPNLANAEGLTPLHVIIPSRVSRNWLGLLFELSHDKYRPLQVDAQDEFGRTPLHTAVLHRKRNIAESLLINGADPNLPDEDGSTPLHVMCKIDYKRTVDPMMECFFKVCDETRKTVRVDYLDNQGRTPLQLAVANLLPNTIDTLLDRGADLTGFVFPTERQFGTKLKMPKFYNGFQNTLIRASGAMIVVERLEKRGYELKRSDALIIMNYFARCKLMEKSEVFIQDLRDHHTFTTRQREESSFLSRVWPPYSPEYDGPESPDYNPYNYSPYMSPDYSQPLVPNNDRQRTKLSLHDLIYLQPKEMMNQLTYSDFFELVQNPPHMALFDELKMALAVHLSEKLSRGFFRRWALDPLMQLTGLPLICCDIISKQFINEDLYHICCATAGQSSRVQ